ncbi:xanthine dehydrogenase family protein [Candidatus Fermentibacteria bacterium]|nr:xanthine dehydrogenase family protein [Candidatus Fermentibacteria bacterium]
MTRQRFSCVGRPAHRVDAADKVRGEARFLADLRFQGMWEAAVATPPVAHALVRRITIPPVDRAEGVAMVAADVPGINQIGIVQRDQPLLVSDRVRSAGDRLAIVAAPTRAAARALADAVSADLKPLPVVEDVRHAMSADAPSIHEGGNIVARLQVVRGDIDAAFAQADVIVEGEYRTGCQEHAYLEPQGAVAVPGVDGRMVVYSTCQCPFYVRRAVADVLGYPQSMVRVVQACTGGAFGGKEDYPSEVAACAALLATASGHPVRLVYDRAEDFRWSTKRHRTVITHRLAATSSGRMLGMQIEALYDAGAYAGLSVVVAERGNSSACGPYGLTAVDVHTTIVYTNGLFGGAFRGFGAPQVTFATERQVDELARRLAIDPVLLREMNLWRSGSVTASGEVLTGSVPVLQTLRRAVRAAGYRPRRLDTKHERVLRGVGVATSYYGSNLHKGGERHDRSHARVTINADGSVNVAVGLTEMGQGLLTAVAQIVAEELGVDKERVVVAHVDTDAVQDSGPTVASRGTIMAGMPTRRAAAALRLRMVRTVRREGIADADIRQGMVVSRSSGQVMTWDDLVGLCYAQRVEMSATGFYRPPPRPYDATTGQGRPYAVNSYTTHIAEVEVDEGTGLVRLVRVTAVHDVGRVIFPEGLRGQIEGGIVQGAGYALFESLVTRGGILHNPGFTDYVVPGIADTPHIRMEVIEQPWKGGPFGAKGIGEPSLIGVAAAIGNAVSDAVGVPVREIPLTPERVLWLLHDRQ